MSGHTKEPWEEFVPCEITADDPAGEYSHVLIAETYNSPNPVGDARRIVDCVNALAGIENPAAFVEAARGMMEAGGALIDYAKQGKGVTADHLNAMMAALAAFRAQIGEA